MEELFLGALNFLGGLFGSSSDSKNAARERAFQAEQNRLSREHNITLANMQNDMNIAQWNRENAYNSPVQQMARYKAAGLNPNLIYGQQNTSPQLSGSLTGGAPATPTRGSFPRNGQMIRDMFSSVGKALLEIPLYRQEVRHKKLENDNLEIRNKMEAQEYDIKTNFFGIGTTDWSKFMEDDELYNDLTAEKPAPVRMLFDRMRQQHFESLEKRESYRERVINNSIKDSTYNAVIRQIMAEANISEQNARYIFDTYTERVAGTRAENMMLVKEEGFMTVDKYIERTAGALNILLNGYSTVYGRKLGIPLKNQK